MPQDIPRILLTAEGYLELGMLDHAALELEHAEPDDRMRMDVLTIRCLLSVFEVDSVPVFIELTRKETLSTSSNRI